MLQSAAFSIAQSPRREPEGPRAVIRVAVWLGLLPVLTGCGMTEPYGMDSPYYLYPAGVRLILNQDLEIPPDSATVRLQYGQVVARNGVQEQDPYCIFELSTVSAGPQRVSPDAFSVTRVQRSTSTIARGESFPVGLVKVGMGDDSSGPTNYYYKTEFLLHSDSQPDVLKMTCQSNQNYTPMKRHLTVQEIRQALGKIFTMGLPSANSVSISMFDQALGKVDNSNAADASLESQAAAVSNARPPPI
jgi:hypothetical protein